MVFCFAVSVCVRSPFPACAATGISRPDGLHHVSLTIAFCVRLRPIRKQARSRREIWLQRGLLNAVLPILHYDSLRPEAELLHATPLAGLVRNLANLHHWRVVEKRVAILTSAQNSGVVLAIDIYYIGERIGSVRRFLFDQL